MDKKTIIAFGDSLTVGFQSPTVQTPWYVETPYADFLSKKMDGKAHFIIRGISGETTDDMLQRFDRDVISENPDFVIILGGTNDLGWGIMFNKIVKNLTSMYESAIQANIKPIAITVPSIRDYDPLIAPRQLLNDVIKKKAKILDIPLIDLFTATAESSTKRLAAEYSNDGLHLSTKGYAVIAELLYEQVFANYL